MSGAGRGNGDDSGCARHPHGDVVPPGLSRRSIQRPTRFEVGLAGALAAALVALGAVLLSGARGHAAPTAAPDLSPSASHRSSTSNQAAREPYQPSGLRRAPTRPAHLAPTRPAHLEPGHSARPRPTRPPVMPPNAWPPVAAATATFVGDLEEGITDGQVALPAGQD